MKLWNAASNTARCSLISDGSASGPFPDFPRLDQSGPLCRVFTAKNLSLTPNSDGKFHIYARDTVTSTVQLVDVGADGVTPISSVSTPFHFSANGNVVVFECPDGALGANPFKLDVFARDLVSNTTEIISTPASTLPSFDHVRPQRPFGFIRQFQRPIRRVLFGRRRIGDEYTVGRPQYFCP